MPEFRHGSKRGNTAIVAGVCDPGVQKTAGLTRSNRWWDGTDR
jgi:hypothetical protein